MENKPTYEELLAEKVKIQEELDNYLYPNPSVPNPCSICKFPISGSHVGTGDGSMKNGGSFAHPECYYHKLSNDLQSKLSEYREGLELLKAVSDKVRNCCDCLEGTGLKERVEVVLTTTQPRSGEGER